MKIAASKSTAAPTKALEMRDRQRCCMHATFHGRSFSRTLFIWLVWREICNFFAVIVVVVTHSFGYYRFEKTLLLLLLCWLLVREMLWKFIQPPFCTHSNLGISYFFFRFFSSFVACSMLVLYIFFLINMHNNVESGQFKCTQRFLRRCNWDSKWEINCAAVKQNQIIGSANLLMLNQKRKTD